MKKCLSIVATLIIAAFLFSSCKSKEERVISKFESLTERIQKNGSEFSDEDWEAVIEEYKALQDEVSKCDFSSEQLKHLGKAEGKLILEMSKEGSKKLGRDASKYIEEGASILDGFFEGLSEDSKE